ncbi:hypothetical protein BC830DRAFT_94744 [Chytriomyces sp. MP71]|nr:hypothetical protein BC830DRAFT_94744 [Chytriomyces sp. MP71]
MNEFSTAYSFIRAPTPKYAQPGTSRLKKLLLHDWGATTASLEEMKVEDPVRAPPAPKGYEVKESTRIKVQEWLRAGPKTFDIFEAQSDIGKNPSVEVGSLNPQEDTIPEHIMTEAVSAVDSYSDFDMEDDNNDDDAAFNFIEEQVEEEESIVQANINFEPHKPIQRVLTPMPTRRRSGDIAAPIRGGDDAGEDALAAVLALSLKEERERVGRMNAYCYDEEAAFQMALALSRQEWEEAHGCHAAGGCCSKSMEVDVGESCMAQQQPAMHGESCVTVFETVEEGLVEAHGPRWKGKGKAV